MTREADGRIKRLGIPGALDFVPSPPSGAPHPERHSSQST